MSEPLRTLLLTNVPAPYRLPLFEALGRELELTVYFCQAGMAPRPWPTQVNSDRVCLERLPCRGWSGGDASLAFVTNPGLRKRLRTRQFDIYIAAENFANAPAVISAQRAAHRNRKPFLLWSGGIDTTYASGHWLSDVYRRWLYRRADAFVAYGERAKHFLVRRGAPAEHIFCGTQGIVPGWIWPVAADKRALDLENKVVVLFAGLLVPRKGVADLIRAHARVASRDSVLVILGDGPQRAALQGLAGCHPNVRFPGYLDGEAKWGYYASADLFVLPTYHDPWPQVIGEAMYFGLPVITTDRDGSADELASGMSAVVPAGNVQALAAAIERLVQDKLLRTEMGRRAQSTISSFTLESACNTFLRAIRYARARS